MIDQQQVLDFLSSPAVFPRARGDVERIDTHISSVFLTEDSVYKLKKQLHYDFLDYSTPDKRRWACEQEVALNRRLAPNVYHGVVAVARETDGELAIDGAGEPVEWLVHMRRLPDDATLLRHIETGSATSQQISTLSAKLAAFYREQVAAARELANPQAAQEYVNHLERHVRGNWEELAHESHGIDQQIVDHVHRCQLRYLALQPFLFTARFNSGRVVDGHGDLRPEHIYFLPEPVIIDCIEFSAEFRQIDVLDELSFLATECEALGADWIGRQLLDEYRTTSGDVYEPLLVDFYASYRACVRAKVHCLRARQLAEAEGAKPRERAAAYLQLAARHAARLDRPVLIVVFGLSGTGKSTVAEALGKSLEVDVLATDAVRQKIFAELDSEARYQPENRQQVYDEMLKQAGAGLRSAAEKLVIVDGTFATKHLRQQAADVARASGAVPLFVHCQCDEQTALERIAARQQRGDSLSEATIDVYRQQVQAFEAPHDDEQARIVTIDSNRELAANVQAIRETLVY
jgi:aminoglycoside phosphotransferase family enzyme/predicted kinase